jgi:hypothetical protein
MHLILVAQSVSHCNTLCNQNQVLEISVFHRNWRMSLVLLFVSGQSAQRRSADKQQELGLFRSRVVRRLIKNILDNTFYRETTDSIEVTTM